MAQFVEIDHPREDGRFTKKVNPGTVPPTDNPLAATTAIPSEQVPPHRSTEPAHPSKHPQREMTTPAFADSDEEEYGRARLRSMDYEAASLLTGTMVRNVTRYVNETGVKEIRVQLLALENLKRELGTQGQAWKANMAEGAGPARDRLNVDGHRVCATGIATLHTFVRASHGTDNAQLKKARRSAVTLIGHLEDFDDRH